MINFKKMFLVFFILSVLLVGYVDLSGVNKSTVKKMININLAGSAQLQTLPRIGKKVAQRILDYRKKHGKFKRVEDLMKVKGIGAKTFKNLKSRITV